MALGSKPWNRSKVLLVGEGRVGKTSLCNTMLGRPFVETESTAGLQQLSCDVHSAAAGSNGRWTEHTKPEKEFEAGVAQLIKMMESTEKHIEISDKSNHEQLSPRNYFKKSRDPEDDRSFNGKGLHNTDTLESCGEFTRNSNKGNMTEGINRTKSNVESSIPLIESDVPLVMKYLDEVRVHDSALILSLFDFGGQSVFNIIHHLFLTSYGVYVVVFNMLSMLDDNNREPSLNELSFWIKSIYMHTLSSVTGKMAPVFLVGTHKDKVNKPTKLKQISDTIKRRFERHTGWPSIEENGDLCFFPVNNRISKPNGILQYLAKCFQKKQDVMSFEVLIRIECIVKDSDFVKVSKPLTWLRALDELLATKKSFLTLEEASLIAKENWVEVDAVPLFLSFLNDMGVVLWLDEEGLRDVVILDIFSFFVEPATLIICNHICKHSDSTIHHKDLQSACRKYRQKEWSEMTQRGLVSQELIEFLLSHKVVAKNISVVINMMLKYGLIVRLEHAQDRSSNILPAPPFPTYYLVPALLPAIAGDPATFQDDLWGNIHCFNSCYFIFTTDGRLLTSKWCNVATLRNEGFLPRGLMERLICKAVQWSQLTNITDLYDITRLYQNYAELSYGHQQFRLVCIAEINCIRLDVEGAHPLPVYNRLLEQINICIKECMGSLQFMTGLRCDASEPEAGFALLNFEALKEVQLKHSSLRVPGYPLINPQYVISKYGPWFNNTYTLPSYDVFISHRWHKDDDAFTEQLYDAFLGQIIGEEKRAVQVFLDKIRIKECQQFQKAFGTALIYSTFFLPVVSSAALKSMQNHNHEKKDNVLIEWMLALECMHDPINSKMRGIFPLLFGGRNCDGSVGNLFAEGVLDRLPDIIPTASIEVAKRLLEENGITVRCSFDVCTVRAVVQELVTYNGLLAWEVQSNSCACNATDRIVERLNNMLMIENIVGV